MNQLTSDFIRANATKLEGIKYFRDPNLEKSANLKIKNFERWLAKNKEELPQIDSFSSAEFKSLVHESFLKAEGVINKTTEILDIMQRGFLPKFNYVINDCDLKYELLAELFNISMSSSLNKEDLRNISHQILMEFSPYNQLFYTTPESLNFSEIIAGKPIFFGLDKLLVCNSHTGNYNNLFAKKENFSVDVISFFKPEGIFKASEMAQEAKFAIANHIAEMTELPTALTGLTTDMVKLEISNLTNACSYLSEMGTLFDSLNLFLG